MLAIILKAKPKPIKGFGDNQSYKYEWKLEHYSKVQLGRMSQTPFTNLKNASLQFNSLMGMAYNFQSILDEDNHRIMGL